MLRWINYWNNRLPENMYAPHSVLGTSMWILQHEVNPIQPILGLVGMCTTVYHSSLAISRNVSYWGFALLRLCFCMTDLLSYLEWPVPILTFWQYLGDLTWIRLGIQKGSLFTQIAIQVCKSSRIWKSSTGKTLSLQSLCLSLVMSLKCHRWDAYRIFTYFLNYSILSEVIAAKNCCKLKINRKAIVDIFIRLYRNFHKISCSSQDEIFINSFPFLPENNNFLLRSGRFLKICCL